MTRTRIGLIIPATNSTAEPDFNMAVPKKVTVHAQRMWNTNELTPETTESMNQGAQEAARYLGQAKIDLLVYACTTGSFFEGPAYDEDLLKRLGKEAGAPAISTSGMAAEALEFLGAKRISVASPYFPWMNRALQSYYEARGFQVLNVETDPKGAANPGQGYCDIGPEEVLEFASRACWPEADALFCAGTAYRSLEVVEELERRLGKPVVSANQASIWAALRRLGIHNPEPGFGSLLDSLARVSEPP